MFIWLYVMRVKQNRWRLGQRLGVDVLIRINVNATFLGKSQVLFASSQAQHAGLFAIGLLVHAIGVAVRAAKARGLLEIAEFIT